ncbi:MULTISPECIES: hypothetical protein [Achromobacter]|jgi:hypothetical protein|uniref:Uncharacterized protein n=1 Tax=Achromobacter aegrifaciens TaxID=1287736 RepID=A0AAD2IZU6_ACHAE|nr:MULTISPECIES: hypothetical protein [Achromobacter]PTN51871.1 hypothetical protein DAI43_07410 [Achromobacter xylosoxidans]MBD9380288.1 hypothetical protein [Achromobacter sp. ACM02]MBD9418661.1 hypothetical protein [Achromobacter sp. ACM04]MBD9429048.1 hypothetical protein [Achromobacter sp. ACM03]MBD9473740.1 hypothetical protein [Achromobacter sp. ACM01]
MQTKRADHEKADTEQGKANAPRTQTEAAHRSGQFGTDKPGFGKPAAAPKRESDKKPNDKGAEYEEGGQYPGKRPGSK